jgi:hypothetical protein
MEGYTSGAAAASTNFHTYFTLPDATTTNTQWKIGINPLWVDGNIHVYWWYSSNGWAEGGWVYWTQATWVDYDGGDPTTNNDRVQTQNFQVRSSSTANKLTWMDAVSEHSNNIIPITLGSYTNPLTKRPMLTTRISRQGAHANDTYDSFIRLYGVWWEYVPNKV